MEGTKSVTDTPHFERRGREAFYMGRSFCMSRGGPCRNEDPAKSSNIAGRVAQPSESQGFADNVNQSAVSQTLRVLLTEALNGKPVNIRVP